MRLVDSLSIVFLTNLFALPAAAQYNSNANPLGPSFPLPIENTLNFNSTNPKQSYTCQYGGGTRSTIFAGLFSGVEKNNSYSLTESGTNAAGSSISAQYNPTFYPGALGLGAGFIVPLKSRNEMNLARACDKILTLVQSQELLNLLSQFKEAGTLSEKDYLLKVGQVQAALLGALHP